MSSNITNTLEFLAKTGADEGIKVGVTSTGSKTVLEIGLDHSKIPNTGFSEAQVGSGTITPSDTPTLEFAPATDSEITLSITGTGASKKIEINSPKSFTSVESRMAGSTSTIVAYDQQVFKINPKTGSEVTIEKTGATGSEVLEVGLSKSIPNPAMESVIVGGNTITVAERNAIQIADATGSASSTTIAGTGNTKRVEISVPKSFTSVESTTSGSTSTIVASGQQVLTINPKTGSEVTIEKTGAVGSEVLEIGLSKSIPNPAMESVTVGNDTITVSERNTIQIADKTGSASTTAITGTGASKKVEINVPKSFISITSTDGTTPVSITAAGQTDLKINPKTGSEVTIEKTGTAGSEALVIGLSKSIPNPAMESVTVKGAFITTSDRTAIEIADATGSASTTTIVGSASAKKVEISVPKAFTSIESTTTGGTISTIVASGQQVFKINPKANSGITIEKTGATGSEILEVGFSKSIPNPAMESVTVGSNTITVSERNTIQIADATGSASTTAITGTGASKKVEISVPQAFTSIESTATNGRIDTITATSQQVFKINPKANSGITIEKTGTSGSEVFEVGIDQSILSTLTQQDFSEEDVIYLSRSSTSSPDGSYDAPFTSLTAAVSAYSTTKTIIKSTGNAKLLAISESLTISKPIDMDLPNTTVTGNITISIPSSELSTDKNVNITLKSLVGQVIISPTILSGTAKNLNIYITLDSYTCLKTNSFIKLVDLTAIGSCNLSNIFIKAVINNIDEHLLDATPIVPLVDVSRINIDNLKVDINLHIHTINYYSTSTTILGSIASFEPEDSCSLYSNNSYIDKTKYDISPLTSSIDNNTLIIPNKSKDESQSCIGEIFFDKSENKFYGIGKSNELINFGIANPLVVPNLNVTDTFILPISQSMGIGGASYNPNSKRFEVRTADSVERLAFLKDIDLLSAVPYLYQINGVKIKTYDKSMELYIPPIKIKTDNSNSKNIAIDSQLIMNLRTITIDDTVFPALTTPLEKYKALDDPAFDWTTTVYSSFLDLLFDQATFTISVDNTVADRILYKILVSGSSKALLDYQSNVIQGCGYKLVSSNNKEIALFIVKKPIAGSSANTIEFVAYANIGHIGADFVDIASAQSVAFSSIRFGNQFHFQLDKGVYKQYSTNLRESVVPHHFVVFFQTMPKTCVLLFSFVERFAEGDYSGQRQFASKHIPPVVKDFIKTKFNSYDAVNFSILRIPLIGGTFNVPSGIFSNITHWRSLISFVANEKGDCVEVLPVIGSGFYSIFESSNIFSDTLTNFSKSGGASGLPTTFDNSGIPLASIVGDCHNIEYVYCSHLGNFNDYIGPYVYKMIETESKVEAYYTVSSVDITRFSSEELVTLSDNNTQANTEKVDVLYAAKAIPSNYSSIKLIKYECNKASSYELFNFKQTPATIGLPGQLPGDGLLKFTALTSTQTAPDAGFVKIIVN